MSRGQAGEGRVCDKCGVGRACLDSRVHSIGCVNIDGGDGYPDAVRAVVKWGSTRVVVARAQVCDVTRLAAVGAGRTLITGSHHESCSKRKLTSNCKLVRH